MKPRPERAEAEALLLQGNTVSYVAKRLNLPEGTVKNWMRSLKKSDIVPAAVDTVPAATLMELGLMFMKDLKAGIETAEILKHLVRDPKWAMRQDAHGMAILIGVIEDKNIRKIEAMERGAGQAQTEE